MMKKKIERKPQELRDRPVPPVKGAVNQQPDVVLRPNAALEQGLVSGPQAVTDVDNWE